MLHSWTHQGEEGRCTQLYPSIQGRTKRGEGAVPSCNHRFSVSRENFLVTGLFNSVLWHMPALWLSPMLKINSYTAARSQFRALLYNSRHNSEVLRDLTTTSSTQGAQGNSRRWKTFERRCKGALLGSWTHGHETWGPAHQFDRSWGKCRCPGDHRAHRRHSQVSETVPAHNADSK